MQKPFSVTKRDFDNALVKLIEDSNIPACVIQQSLEGILRQVAEIAEQTYLKDKAEYEKSLEGTGE